MIFSYDGKEVVLMKEEFLDLFSKGIWQYSAEVKIKRKYVYIRVYKYSRGAMFQFENLLFIKVPKSKFDKEQLKEKLCQCLDSDSAEMCSYCAFSNYCSGARLSL